MYNLVFSFIQDKYSHPIITADWGGEEEMLLVEGLETCGIGNWQDISDHVGTKTLEECRDHYIKYYLDSPDYPLPARPNFDKAEAEAIRKKRRINPSMCTCTVV